MLVLELLLELFVVIIITDILGAIGHWVMDSYGNPSTPIIGPAIFKPNVDHHKDPNALIENSWIDLISTSIAPVLFIDLIIWAVWGISWHILVGSILLANVNIIHKWCHCHRQDNPWLVNLLHDLHILQTPNNHALHHEGNQDQHYAAITNITNPIFEYFNVWRHLEYTVYQLTRIKPKGHVRDKRKSAS